jgi:hypothetical protein
MRGLSLRPVCAGCDTGRPRQEIDTEADNDAHGGLKNPEA